MKELLKFKGALASKKFHNKKTLGRLGTNKNILLINDKEYDGDELMSHLMNPYTVDLNKVLNSKAFRRLADKIRFLRYQTILTFAVGVITPLKL